MNCFRSKNYSSKSLSPTKTTSPPNPSEQNINIPEPKNVKHEVLLRIPGCKLHLMDGGEALELSNGDFTLFRISDENVSIATTIKVGDDLQWPLTRDEPVVKLDALHYLFSLPVKGATPLSYGVTFSEQNGGNLKLLDTFLSEHSCFSSSSPSSSSRNKDVDWKEFAPRIDDYNNVLAKAIAGGTGQIVKGIFKLSNAYTNQVQKGGEMIIQTRAAEGIKNGVLISTESNGNMKSNAATRKSNVNKSIKRVRKLSKMTEKMSKALLDGVGVATGSIMGPVVRSQAGKAFLTMVPGQLLLASLDAVRQTGGCIVVDSTRKGKRFPDSMSKTIPIWTCVLNRAILNYRNKMGKSVFPMEEASNVSGLYTESTIQDSTGWDCSLHLPLWVPGMEKAAIENHLDGWTKQLETSGADIAPLVSLLKKPLRPLWISQKSVIWLNEVPEHDSWDFTPIILVSASSPSGYLQQKSTSQFSWNYISGAGDDEESWARGLSPTLFWNHAIDIINLGPDQCNQKVADIVEKDRVYRAQRGHNAPQLSLKSSKFLGNISHSVEEPPLDLKILDTRSNEKLLSDDCAICWLGPSNIAVCATRLAVDASNIDGVLNCDKDAVPASFEACFHLPIVDSKLDRFSLLRNLPSTISFAKATLGKGKRLLVCCSNGEDISICVCLAILTSLFTVEGCFDDGKSFSETSITKLEMRQRLVFICKFAVNARPSRGNLRQVFNFLNHGSCSYVS